MSLKPRRTAAAAAIAACVSMTAAPAFAVDLPLPRAAAVGVYDATADSADGWRHRRNRGGGIGTGEIIAGVAVLGAIAAIASSASRNRDTPRRSPAPDREPVRDDNFDSSGLSRAADMCVAAVERDRRRVVSVDDVTRDAEGWRVSGEVEGGEGFTCRIGNDGRIRDVEVGQSQGYDTVAYADGGNGSVVDRQYSDDVYARVRAGQPASGQPAYDEPAYEQPAYDSNASDQRDVYTDEPRPAYPGGPLPGEEGYDDYASGTSAADDYDGRYER